jgi:tetratricopeptide (TPR) repeat protein
MERNDSGSALKDAEDAIEVGRNPKAFAVFAASTAGLLGSSPAHGPLSAASALIPGRIPLHLAESHLLRGRILHFSKSYKEAADAYGEALRIRPDYAEAHRLRGQALLKIPRYQEAIDSFDQCLARGIPDVPTYLARAWAKTRLGQKASAEKVRLALYASAIEDYTLALNLKPSSEIYAYRGWLHVFCDAPKMAQTDFEDAIRLDATNAEAWNGLGYAQVVQGQYRQGIKDANKALELGPESTRLLYNAARTFAQAVGRMDSDTARRSQADLETRNACQTRAVQLTRNALQKLPPGNERWKFWYHVVRTDRAFDPIRLSLEWALLETAYWRPGT